jgi:RNA polymerase sigma-70 factor (ECF subfamily)
MPDDPDMDDVRLMEGVAARDPSALRALHARHAGGMFAVCLRVLRDRADAEDVLADVFAELWQRGERFDPSRGAVTAYLLGVTRSRCLDRLRRRRRDRAASDGAAATLAAPAGPRGEGPHARWAMGGGAAAVAGDPARVAEVGEARGRVRDALRSLNADQRAAIDLAYYDGMSHTEIARHLGEPLGTIKARIRQGLIRLRDVLRNAHKGEDAL